MKFISFIMALTIICSVLSSSDYVNAYEVINNTTNNDSNLLSEYAFEAVSDENYHVEEANYVIYGNYTDFDSSLLHSLINNENNICIFYDLDLSNNVSDNLEILRNNVVIYYYSNGIPYVHSYTSNETNTQLLMNDITSYVNEIFSKKLHNDTSVSTPDSFLRFSPYTTGSETFEPIYAGSFRETSKPAGYIDCDFVVRKYRANDISSLYLIEAEVSFVPGQIARDMGDWTYASWYNNAGYIKIKATEATNEVGYGQVRHGGTPVFKDAYPVNNPGTISINSSYSAGINLGTSTNLGFSTTGANVGGGTSSSLDISYSYSKTYTNQEPALSAQKDSSDMEKYTWLYSYTDSRNEANNLQVGYMFEMNNSGHDLLEGDLAVRFEYQMTVGNGWQIFEQFQTFNGSKFYNYY